MLILHIGRGKTGSTSLQRALHAQRERVLAAGLFVPDASATLGNHAEFVAALRGEPGAQHSLQAVKDSLADPHARVLLTSEFLFDIKADAIQRVQEVAQDHEVLVIAYLRDYPSWVPSFYAQPTKKGKNLLSFDDFYAAYLDTFSAFPALERWACVFGWPALSVRPVVNDRVGARTLFEDFSDAIGVELVEERRQNSSPHWLGLELRREFAAINRAISSDDSHFLRWLLEQSTKAAQQAGLAPAYLSSDQVRELDHLYQKDLRRLSALTGRPLSVPTAAEQRCRETKPTISKAPVALRQELVEECLRYDRRPVSDDTRQLAISLLMGEQRAELGTTGA